MCLDDAVDIFLSDRICFFPCIPGYGNMSAAKPGQ